MTAQVIFLNRFYWPDEETHMELDKMQEFLTFCHAQFELDYRNLPPDEIARRKNKVHQDARNRLGIVKMVDL
jgi:hypothetical protein